MNKSLLIILLITTIFFVLFLAGCDETPDPGPTAAPTLAPGETEEPTDVPTVAPTDIPVDTPVPTQQPNIIYNLNATPGSEWAVGSTNCDWIHGTVTNASADYPTDAICFGTNLNSTYGDNRTIENNYVQLGPLDFESFFTAGGLRMKFKLWIFVEDNADYAFIQYKVGTSAFTAITGTNVSGYGYTDTLDDYEVWSPNKFSEGVGWRDVTIDLSALGLVNETDDVYFRWVLKSDVTVNYPGVYIDDINIGYDE